MGGRALMVAALEVSTDEAERVAALMVARTLSKEIAEVEMRERVT